jgi:Protein of unknown function (DUF1612)/HTH DNA binding domain
MRYVVGDLPLQALLPAVVRAEDKLARLDERALRHPVGEGFRERGHFFDAVAALWVGGELVHVEDLVLHDAHMDARVPTHELTIAHAVLRARRRLISADPDWGMSAVGIAALRSGEGALPEAPRATPQATYPDEVVEEDEGEVDTLRAAMAEIDAVIARSSLALADKPVSATQERALVADPLGLIHDDEWDEDERVDAWRAVAREADHLPPVLGAVLLFDAWEHLQPLRRQHWLGSLLVSGYLRCRGKTSAHLFSLNVGMKSIRHERRRASSRSLRLLAFLEAIEEAGETGLNELDRLSLAKTQMERRLRDRRSNSSLPGVIELVLSRPIVSAGMIARHVGVTPRGALNLVAELGLRELTGRGRYRGWGVL